MDSSRFAHFNTINGDFKAGDESMDTQDGFDTSSNTNSTMTVTAGIRLQNLPNTGSFVTAIINGGDKPDFDKATVIKPTSNGQNGQGDVITYSDLDMDQGIRENGKIGNVSFSNGGTLITHGRVKGTLGNNSVTYSLIDPLKPFCIRVRYQANISAFRVTSADTVDQLKERIRAEFGLSPEQQQLVHDGKNLAGGVALQHYGLQEGYEISLTLRYFCITVYNHGNNRRPKFNVTSTETVDQLKERIRAEFGLKPEEQQLVFAGKNLASGMLLQHYGIGEGSEVLLTCRLRGG